MRSYNIHHIDSFTNTLFGGNPTVTVLDADSLSEEEMKKIAREMNLSETGFVVSSTNAHFRLRFFTPTGDEIRFCGHATVGALCSIAKEGLFGCNQRNNFLKIETNAGILPVEISLENKEAPKFSFNAPKITLATPSYSITKVIEALGIPEELIDLAKPAVLEETNSYLYLTARNLNCLGKIRLDIEKAIHFAKKYNIIVFCILTNETFHSSSHFHTRGFASLVGVPEDPFTGSMQGGLAAYAIHQGMLPNQTRWIQVEQGHFMDRPGFAKLEIACLNPIDVKLHCEAVHVFSSELHLP